MLEHQISEILAGKNKDYVNNFANGHGTIFHDIIFNSNLPPKDLELERLRDEGQGLVMAGTVTTSRCLYMMAYYLLANPEILRKLREELREPMKDYPVVRPKWTELEKLPYLSAVIKEGLRYVVLPDWFALI
jgi:cytochrome P450